MQGLRGKTAMVTGAGGGIGTAVCQRLAKEGVKLALVDLREEALNQEKEMLVRECGCAPEDILAVPVSVTDEEGMLAAADRIAAYFGRIDIDVNIAGGGPRGKERVPFNETKREIWKSSVELNMVGTILSCEAVVNHMIRQNYGKIINFGSQQGVIGGATNVAVYSAAKGANIAFTRSLAKELAKHNIRVNCISPGLIWNEARHSLLSPEILDTLKANMWLEDIGQPEDIASLVAFLASEESEYITGQNFNIDGGTSLGW